MKSDKRYQIEIDVQVEVYCLPANCVKLYDCNWIFDIAFAPERALSELFFQIIYKFSNEVAFFVFHPAASTALRNRV